MTRIRIACGTQKAPALFFMTYRTPWPPAEVRHLYAGKIDRGWWLTLGWFWVRVAYRLRK